MPTFVQLSYQESSKSEARNKIKRLFRFYLWRKEWVLLDPQIIVRLHAFSDFKVNFYRINPKHLPISTPIFRWRIIKIHELR